MKQAVIGLLLVLIVTCALHRVHGEDFEYKGPLGPEHWGHTCGGGKHQSPININILKVEDKQFPPLLRSGFDEAPVSGDILNNAHTVLVKLNYAQVPPSISNGPFPEADTFQFQQFHFHWGENNTIGSEDRINNITFPAELHMVFFNNKYGNFEKALWHGDGVAVLAFFYALQKHDNPNYGEFIELLGNVREPSTGTKFRNPPKIEELITKNLDNYYTYSGSLTTPPCTENVTWIDFATPIEISFGQIESFRHLRTNGGAPLTHNFRPLQPLNDRLVYKAILPSYPKQNEPRGAGSLKSTSLLYTVTCLILASVPTF